MFRNYLMLTLRNLKKHKVITFINIAGLVIAFTSCIFIALFVFDELSYDGFHKNTDQIFRVRQKVDLFGFSPTTSWLLAEKLTEEFPEVKTAARIQIMDESIYFRSEKELLKENKYLFADNSLFRIFSFPFVSGDSETALSIPNSVVISKKIAAKYFGTKNPLGQMLHVNISSKWYDLQVTGVLENIPANSDFNVDFMFSSSVLYEIFDNPGRKAPEPHPMERWERISIFTYVLLNRAGNLSDLEIKMGKFFQEKLPNSYIKEVKLEPLTSIHLYNITDTGDQKPGSIIYVYLFSIIGFLVLLIAGINFVILSTANSSVRAKEIGLRKVIGAKRTDLVKQFLSESILLAFLAFPLSLIAVELLLPSVNTLLNKQFGANYFQLWQFILALLGTTLIVGLFSGGYAAFYLSALSPITTLQNNSLIGNARSGLRKTLIVLQFTIFIALLVCSLVISQQIGYIRESNPGFQKEQLLAIDMGKTNFGKHFNAFKQDIMHNPGVVNISAGSTLPMTRTAVMFQTTSLIDNPEKKIQYWGGYVDYDFFKTLGAHILQGRVFSQDYSQDLTESVVLNRTAAQKFGLNNSIGQMIQLQDGPKRVIGVVDDFVVSCYYETQPLVYYLKPGNPIIGTMVLRLSPGNISSTLKYLEKTWYQYSPDAVFAFQFIDDEINRQYEKDLRFGKIITTLTGLSILIASMGLFGLSLFMIRRRNKEIGIRKILGASIRGLIFIQTKEMILLVIIGSCIACPIAYYLMSKWLQDFAYKIDLSLWVFVLSGGIALVIALATVSFQAIKAAIANPVESLRYE
ncbi:MAG: ABC transporter permease [Ignavibacteria bacterium]|jgi:putative ABC transport system permease protein